MQMIRIKEEGWIITVVSSRWYLQFEIFMRNIFLLIIHAIGKRKKNPIRKQCAPKRERYLPHDPHQLTSDDGVAAVGANA